MSISIPHQPENSTALVLTHKSSTNLILDWAVLPAEIRLMIWEDMAEGYHYGTPTKQDLKVARLATVSREWQRAFESFTFRRLTVRSSSLGKFGNLVAGRNAVRLSYTRHLWLKIELNEYHCNDCQKAEDRPTINCNNQIFTFSMSTLLRILSQWTPQNGEGAGAMTLELSAHSISDYNHELHSFMLQDDYLFNCEEDLGRVNKVVKKDHIITITIAKSHQYKRHRQTRFRRSPGELTRLIGSPLDFCSGSLLRGRKHAECCQAAMLPKTPIIRGLLIRRQFYRRFSAQALATLFRESLVRAEWLRLERWTEVSASRETRFNTDFASLVSSLPKSLKRLHFTKSPSAVDFELGLGTVFRYNADKGQVLSSSLVSACYHVQELSIPGDVEATDFFSRLVHYATRYLSNRLRRFNVCTRLRRLIIQGPIPDLEDCCDSVYACIEAAAHAVRVAMPDLQELEIWNFANPDFQYIFTVGIADRRPKIAWRRSSPHKFPEFPSSTMQAWKDAVDKTTTRSLQSVEGEIQAVPEEEQAKLFRQLKLWKLMFDPITLAQIESGNDAAWTSRQSQKQVYGDG